MNHLLLTSASSISVMSLMMSPGKVRRTDLRGTLHPSLKLIPKTKHTAKTQYFMMRSSADSCKIEKKKLSKK